jgi:hypothetical protein
MRPRADADADGQCLTRHLSASAPLRHLRTSVRTLRTFQMSAPGARPSARTYFYAKPGTNRHRHDSHVHADAV